MEVVSLDTLLVVFCFPQKCQQILWSGNNLYLVGYEFVYHLCFASDSYGYVVEYIDKHLTESTMFVPECIWE